MTQPGQSTLIVGPSWLGDMVMAQSLFRLLRQREPRGTLDVVAPGWSGPVVERMPEVRRVHALPVGHGELALGTRWRLGRRLRRERYDRAIVLPRSLKSALVPFLAGIPLRTGHLGESRWGLINDRRPRNRDRTVPMVEKIVALGLPPHVAIPSPLPRPALTVDAGNRRRLVAGLGLETDRPIVACLPGAAYGPAKAWPVESYGALSRRLFDAGRRVWILGSDGDRQDGEAIVRASRGTAINLCGQTQLVDAIDLLSLVEEAVANDSGLLHVAAAVGARVLAIYGSSTPAYTPPLTDRATVFHLGLDCSPCFDRRCRFSHYRCLREIDVDSVFAATTAGIGAAPGAPAHIRA